VIYLIGSSVAFVLFGVDKRAARQRSWRVSERTLLLSALCFGFAGALVAQRLFRHKTRKQPFATILLAISALHVGLIAAMAWRGWL
jgi:uncharacterized membrane protein YsdA (DUF1294 family)